MSTALTTGTKHWTYEEYYQLNHDQRYEVIEGSLLMVPASDTFHQDWIGELFLRMWPHVKRHKLGRVFLAPCDVVWDAEHVVQPDLIFVSAANAGIIQRRAIMGSPDLVVEVISPSSLQKDRYRKKQTYARFGVKEYWLVDPANETLEVLVLKQPDYELFSFVSQKGAVRSCLLPNLEFDLADIRPGPG